MYRLHVHLMCWRAEVICSTNSCIHILKFAVLRWPRSPTRLPHSMWHVIHTPSGLGPYLQIRGPVDRPRDRCDECRVMPRARKAQWMTWLTRFVTWVLTSYDWGWSRPRGLHDLSAPARWHVVSRRHLQATRMTCQHRAPVGHVTSPPIVSLSRTCWAECHPASRTAPTWSANRKLNLNNA